MVQHLVGDEVVEFAWIEALVVELPADARASACSIAARRSSGDASSAGSDADEIVRDLSLHAAADERTVAGDGRGRPGRGPDRCQVTAHPVAPCARQARYWSASAGDRYRGPTRAMSAGRQVRG
jgi:hypothetical protein